MHQPFTEHLPGNRGVALLLVGPQQDVARGHLARECSHDPAHACAALVGSRAVSFVPVLAGTPSGTKRCKSPDRTNCDRHHEPGLLLDQYRHRQRPDRSALVALFLVEHEAAALGQRWTQVVVQQGEVPGHLEFFVLHGAGVHLQEAPGLTQTNAAGQQHEQAAVGIGAVVAIVLAEGLAREPAPASAAAEAGHTLTATGRLVVAAAPEEAWRWSQV